MLIKDFLLCEARLSATLIKTVKYGYVSVNGETVTMRRVLCEGDRVEIRFPEERSENVEPIPHPIRILYEDEDILAVDKPINMPTHPSRGNHLVTLGNAVAAYIGKPFVFRAITRLDRDTSGVVIIAKNPYSAALLSAEMKRGDFEKYYTAHLSRVPSPESGTVDAPIERECEGSIKRVVREDGKRAVTEYRTLARTEDGGAICELKLLTGRTHQIRVHMAHIGCPLKNDFLYGEHDGEGTYSLRASRVVFTHPRTGDRLEILA